MSRQKQLVVLYQERLMRMRRISFPQTAEAVLFYLGLIGDAYRLRESLAIGTNEPELEMVLDFFDIVTPETIEEALCHACGRSTSEVALQPDVGDAKALGTFASDRDRLTSIKVALTQLYQHRRWSEGILPSRERFEHALRAYDVWLENQYAAHGIGAGDVARLLGECSVLGFLSRSV